MGFFGFIFVLLIIVPIAVLMLYLINNLNDKLNIAVKNEEKARQARRDLAAAEERNNRVPEGRYEAYQRYRRQQEESQKRQGSEPVKRTLGGSFDRSVTGYDSYKKETPYYIKRQEKIAEETTNRQEQDNKGQSKRKRRKARKNRKKVREK